jgi:hypothetical protein
MRSSRRAVGELSAFLPGGVSGGLSHLSCHNGRKKLCHGAVVPLWGGRSRAMGVL